MFFFCRARCRPVPRQGPVETTSSKIKNINGLLP
jgi:hypothetical protein